MRGCKRNSIAAPPVLYAGKKRLSGEIYRRKTRAERERDAIMERCGLAVTAQNATACWRASEESPIIA